jgi:hypothetical protein
MFVASNATVLLILLEVVGGVLPVLLLGFVAFPSAELNTFGEAKLCSLVMLRASGVPGFLDCYLRYLMYLRRPWFGCFWYKSIRSIALKNKIIAGYHKICIYMPRFLDVHSMKGLDEDILKKLQDSPLDEFRVKHLNILHNPEAG